MVVPTLSTKSGVRNRKARSIEVYDPRKDSCWWMRCWKAEGQCNLNESTGRLPAALTVIQLK